LGGSVIMKVDFIYEWLSSYLITAHVT
jgi:hypothetical protein